MAPPDASVDGGEPDAGPLCGCEQWGNPRNDGLLNDPLNEVSGLVVSRRFRDVFFAHNDSGDTARFFAVSKTAQLFATYTLDGVTAIDWEDLGIGPCPAGTCVFLGDVGDNTLVRADYAVYRVPEPTTLGSGSVTWERLRFGYPGSVKRNSEAIFVHPTTGRIYVITKPDFGVSEVYRFPEPVSTGALMTLELVATLSIPTATDRPLTGADVNPCGTAVLMRMYNRLVEYRLPAGETNFERIFETTPITVPIANEAQGEAVAYGPDGRTYWTASEKLVDTPPLYEYRCR
jgi:hypothetical protein